MKYRYLGSSGLQVSELSFGSWVTFSSQIGEDVAADCMQAAYDAGVNFFDNAESYAEGASEVMMGNVIRKSGWKRSDLVIATKVYWGGPGPNDRGLSRKHVIEGANASLQRMQLDYVDLLYCHRPDRSTPVEETVRAMNHLIDQGKVFYWGTSEWSAEEIREAHEVARRERLIGPTMEQPQYNMFHRERVEVEYSRLYEAFGLGLTTWSPLASGILTGKYSGGIPDDSRLKVEGYEWLARRLETEKGREQLKQVELLGRVAGEIDATTAQLALAWCLKNPRVSSVITGASRPEQVEQNMKAADVADRLSPSIMQRIEGILKNRPEPPVSRH